MACVYVVCECVCRCRVCVSVSVYECGYVWCVCDASECGMCMCV